MRKKTRLLVVVIGAAMVLTGCGVKQTATTLTVEAGQKLQMQATDFFNIKEEKADKITFDTSKVDTATVGEYEVTATYNKKNYTIHVTVQDTTAPVVEFKQRYAILNDASAFDPMELIENISDMGECEVVVAGFEKSGELEVMDENGIKKVTGAIPVPCDQKALAEITSTEIPTEEGIYRTILAVTDASGNVQLEEVALILDTTGANIAEVEDKVIEVDAEELSTAPEINPKDYTATDNVDGTINIEDMTCELELRDEEKHEYVVKVSHEDRAGNDAYAEFLITLKEKPVVVAQKETPTDNSGGNEQQQTVTPEPTPEPTPAPEPTPDTNQNQESTFEPVTPDNEDYDPVQEAVINAGYYNVIPISNDDYAVMVHNDEDNDVLREFLDSIDCNATRIYGGVISYENDQHIYVAEDVYYVDPNDNDW